MRDRSRESGQSAVLVMFAMLGLLGFTGLGVDVGMLFHAKRNLQTAADSAAVAGAIEASYTDMTYDAAGKAASALDGYTNGVNGVTVLMNNPPQSGPHTTDARYVEAIVSQPQTTFFMRVFGFSSVNVRARAVAYRGAASTNCMYILDPNNDPATLQLQGSFTVNAPNCGIVVNSPNGGALQYTGSGGSLTAGSVGVVGGCSGQCSSYTTPSAVTSIAPVSDPLPSLPAPTYTPASCSTATTLTGAVSPGCYSAQNITIQNATLSAGTYIFSNTSGTVQFSGTVDGSAGVTLYTQGSINASNGTLDLVAPTSGTYEGIVMFADRSDTGGQIMFDKGSASGSITGIIYAPDTPMELHDSGGDINGGLQLTTDLIVYKLFDKTATLSITSYSLSNPSSTPLSKVALAE